MNQLLTFVLQFLKNPTEEAVKNQSVSTKIKWLFLLLFMEIPVMFLLSYLQSIPEHYGFIDTSQHRIVEMVKDGNLLLLIIVVVILAPFAEELIIRLPLRIKKNYFIPFIFLGLLLNGMQLAHKPGGKFSLFLFIPVILTILSAFLIFNKRLFEKTSILLKLRYGLYFYSMSGIFALLHLFNYQFNGYVLLFAPLLVLPQFFAGLLMGFLRLKSGFFWGFFLHVLHNALFLLPFYFLLNNPMQITFDPIKKDGYTFEVTEGKSHKKEIASISKILPDEIILSGTFEEVVSRLTKKRVREIEFKNGSLAKKKIRLSFKNDSAYTSNKTDSACHYTLQSLLNNYNLQLKTGKRWTSSWVLKLYDEKLFQNHVSNTGDFESKKQIRNFYGSRDTIYAQNINSEYLTKLIQLNCNILVDNKLDRFLSFTVKVPNDSPSRLNKYLKKNYGIELKQKRKKVNFLIVEKR